MKYNNTETLRDGKDIEISKKKTINLKVKKTFGIVPGKYKLKQILDKLHTEIRFIAEGLDQTTVTYDKESDRVVITGNQKKLLISSYTKHSILQLLGYANQIRTNKDQYLLKKKLLKVTDKVHILLQVH